MQMVCHSVCLRRGGVGDSMNKKSCEVTTGVGFAKIFYFEITH